MPTEDHRLTSLDVARFVADGYLRFDALVPDEINRPAAEEMGPLAGSKIAELASSSS